MSYLRNTVNLGNSIVGVSILSMPWCFKRCGILLSIFMIFLSGLLNRAGCHLLLRSAIISKRRNPEALAYHTFGPTGKLMVEIGVLGFLVGTCVAYFVTLGDLSPSLISQLFLIPNSPHLRAFLLTFLGLFIALPLGLLRRVDSLTSFSALSLGLYAFLVLKLFSEASGNLIYASKNHVMDEIKLWDNSAILSVLPIFAMALSCQTQLFEIFDSSFIFSDDFNSMKKMNHVIKGAINIVSMMYIMVGLFGYFAYYTQPFRGNILVFLPLTFTSTLVKFGFIFTVVVSLPLCLFPCRTSLHSLLFRRGFGSYSTTEAPLIAGDKNFSMYMSDKQFRLLTIAIIITTIVVSVLIPNIEFVLGIIGSTIGAIICFIFPGLIFIKLTKTNTTERIMAHIVAIIGVFILILCTFSTLKDAKILSYNNEFSPPLPQPQATKLLNEEKKIVDQIKKVEPKFTPKSVKAEDAVKKSPPLPVKQEKVNVKGHHSQVPFQMDEKKLKKQEELLARIEKQQQEHKKLLEQQKEILKEIKEHDDTHHDPVNPPEKEPDAKPKINLKKSEDLVLPKNDLGNLKMDEKIPENLAEQNKIKVEEGVKEKSVLKEDKVVNNLIKNLDNNKESVDVGEKKSEKVEPDELPKENIESNILQQNNPPVPVNNKYKDSPPQNKIIPEVKSEDKKEEKSVKEPIQPISKQDNQNKDPNELPHKREVLSVL